MEYDSSCSVLIPAVSSPVLCRYAANSANIPVESFQDKVYDLDHVAGLDKLSSLVAARIRDVIASSSGNVKIQQDPLLTELLNEFTPDRRDYERYALFKEDETYSRNLVSCGEDYDLVLLCWNPGKASPIHDHPGSNCHMKVLEGEIFEDLYDSPVKEGDQPMLKRHTVMEKGFVGYVNDSLGLHRIGNPSNARPAISLHLYSPPIRSCTVVPERGGSPQRKQVTFHSIFGQCQQPASRALETACVSA
eukprot:CAMPEP_0181313496 /NCGR_PEP_ID=MMETSP1101-20121128/14278_1 /TAXON_ID=46948 /ORGANISM="Rhodomonas abbreviata, Strain Caron Lab Isolate" /LENGTH=247 /DNA_ID=CAMNT_0023420451 /DNA_START=450 /DNA_END=1193 /DNA_ORIENTATION=+